MLLNLYRKLSLKWQREGCYRVQEATGNAALGMCSGIIGTYSHGICTVEDRCVTCPFYVGN